MEIEVPFFKGKVSLDHSFINILPELITSDSGITDFPLSFVESECFVDVFLKAVELNEMK